MGARSSSWITERQSVFHDFLEESRCRSNSGDKRHISEATVHRDWPTLYVLVGDERVRRADRDVNGGRTEFLRTYVGSYYQTLGPACRFGTQHVKT